VLPGDLLVSLSLNGSKAIHLGSIGHKHFSPNGWLHHKECEFVQPQRATHHRLSVTPLADDPAKLTARGIMHDE
jgi:hypothetical protein